MKNLNSKTISEGFKLLGLESDRKIKYYRDMPKLEKLSDTNDKKHIEWPNTVNNTEIKKDHAKLEPTP